MNIFEVIKKETSPYFDKTALIDGERKITYAGLFTAVDKASARLARQGIRRGSRVALPCEDNIDYIVSSLAVLKLSAVIVPIPLGSSKEETKTLFKEMKVLPSQDAVPQEFFTLNPAFIRFSSGTTGLSKGVVISHEAIIQRTDAANKGLRIICDDKILWVLSMSFHFVVTILLFLRRGATIILAGNSFPDKMLAALNKHRPSFIYASPIHYRLITKLDSVRRQTLSNVRLAVSTAVGLPLETAENFSAKFGFELSQAYGIIEVGLPFINTTQDKRKRGSVGKILPGYELKIANKDKEGVGEIYLKGRGFFSAYFSPWQKAGDCLKDGWFAAGDLGRLDEDKFLFLMGRTKDVINFGGMKIFPCEVESVLNRHPLVKESLVYGLSHPEYGALAAAAVVLREPAKNNFKTQTLAAFCYRHLAKYKVPKEFRVVKKLEKTLSGKIKR